MAKTKSPTVAKCRIPDCNRPAYARGLCQTHHRQFIAEGRTKQIRPYRKRQEGTVKFAGLRLTPDCVKRIKLYAKQRNISYGAAIAELLESWHANGH
jgi:hypothetical protein